MLTVFTKESFAARNYTHDHLPPHVHVQKAKGDAKVQLDPVKIIANFGFSVKQLRQVQELFWQIKAIFWKNGSRYMEIIEWLLVGPFPDEKLEQPIIHEPASS